AMPRSVASGANVHHAPGMCRPDRCRSHGSCEVVRPSGATRQLGECHRLLWETTMISRRRLLLSGTALSVAAAISGRARSAHAEAATDTSAGQDAVAWLRANALPLASAEPGTPFDDLAPLRAMLGRARVVSMGEATHGTREVFKLKHRLIEYCVSELGFTIIAFEANYGSMLAVNDY